MERKKICIRIKNNIYERFNLISKEFKISKQELFDEIIELGLIEKMKGGLSNERLFKQRERDIKK